jgi:hypothetical protein
MRAQEEQWAYDKAKAIADAEPSTKALGGMAIAERRGYLRGYLQALNDACCTVAADPRSLRYGRQLSAKHLLWVRDSLETILKHRGWL